MLPNKVRERRKEIGIPVADLARRVGIAPVFLYQIETGDRVPSLKTAYRISNILLRKVEQLFPPEIYAMSAQVKVKKDA